MSDDEYPPHPDDMEDFRPWTADADPIEVAPGVYLPSWIHYRPWVETELAIIAEQTGKPVSEFPITMETHMELVDYVYEIKRFVIQAHGDRSVDGKLLRSLAIGDIIEDPIRFAARVRRRDDGKLMQYEMHNLREAAIDGPTDANLKSVARVYAVGHAMKIRPTAAVEDALGLKRSTAENWVRRAKDKGFVFAEL